MMPSPEVTWHDVECGGYTADLDLWRELAREADGAVLDVGAGTGRVALPLAADGHAVTALDRDGVLLAALAERAAAAGVEVETVVADAADFELSGFALVLVPMQTIQLLPGADARAGFFASARRALEPGGRVALALAETPEPFGPVGDLPEPDVGERDGWRFVSQPIAIRVDGDRWRIERARILVAPDGTRSSEPDVVELAGLTADELAAEGAAQGFAAEPARSVPETEDHVGSQVVILRG
jgi:SAM-dependent methyltransferase